MTKAKTVRLIYGIVLSISLVAAGICLMAACVGIYQSGDRAFSRDSVAAAFSPIAVPVYTALVLAAGSFVLDAVLPADSKKRKPEKDCAAILRRLWEKRDLQFCGPSLLQAIRREQKLRKREYWISIIVLTVCGIGFLFYGANPANFPASDINGSMAKATVILLACLTVPFGCALCTAYRARKSMQREIELVRSIAPSEQPQPTSEKKNPANILRWALLCVGVAILVYGYLAGGTLDVLTKAVNICTECVGLG